MIFKLIQEENGNYTDLQGNRYSLLVAEQYIDTPEGRNVNCVELSTENEALLYYNIQLVPQDEDDNNE